MSVLFSGIIIYFPTKNWNGDIVDLSKAIGELCIKLFSYEVKRSLGFYNLRECFFQAVSNSSWANEGYLAVAELNNDEDFLSELKRLSNSFGIGIIRLDIAEPDNSEIVLPAKTRDTLDWETINKLANENQDFRDFIVSVKDNTYIKGLYKENFDKIFDSQSLKERYSKYL